MWLILFCLCVVVVAVTIAIDVRDERRKTQKIAELEAQVVEKNTLIQQLLAPKRAE